MQVSEQVNAEKVVLRLTGKLDFHARKTFHESINHAKVSNPKQVIVNFSKVSFVDSAGLGLLLLCNKQLVAANIALSIEGVSGYVEEVLNLANIGKIIPISGTKN